MEQENTFVLADFSAQFDNPHFQGKPVTGISEAEGGFLVDFDGSESVVVSKDELIMGMTNGAPEVAVVSEEVVPEVVEVDPATTPSEETPA